VTGQYSYMVDGGITDKFPIHVFDRATRQRLYDDGFAAMRQFLDHFSFADYRQVWTTGAVNSS
jgi:hypothetical protein